MIVKVVEELFKLNLGHELTYYNLLSVALGCHKNQRTIQLQFDGLHFLANEDWNYR